MENYDVVKTIGRGSYGKVYLAVHRATGKQVRPASQSKPRRQLLLVVFSLFTGCAQSLQAERSEERACQETPGERNRDHEETQCQWT